MRLLPILTALALTCVSAPTRAQRTAPRPVPSPRPVRPPNVVLLVADDLGYRDLGVQGMRDIATPNIDRLAREGVQFTDGYMVSSLCSPSRAGILTGRYPERWGQELNPGRTVPSDSAFGIPQNQPLLSERLKSLGYATGIFGKWHEGYRPANLPTARGFDEFVGFLGPAQAYRQNWIPFRYSKLQRGTQLVRERSFLTDAFAREAVRFIDQRVTDVVSVPPMASTLNVTSALQPLHGAWVVGQSCPVCPGARTSVGVTLTSSPLVADTLSR